jgi:hypothetical protein
MPRESVAAYRRHFERLLLSDEEFQNLSWEPSGRLEEFCRERLRPALLLVHRCTLEGTDPRVISTDIPPEEKDELRLILLRLVGTTVSAGFSSMGFLPNFRHNHIDHNSGRGFFRVRVLLAARICASRNSPATFPQRRLLLP